MRWGRLFRWFAALLLAALLSGCDSSSTNQSASDEVEAATPVATVASRLDPDAAKPLRYRLDLRIDPRAPAFIGQGEIDVELGQPTDTIRLHGRDLIVSEAAVRPAGGDWQSARYEQKGDFGEAILQSGPLPAGEVTLRFKWSAPYQEGPAGLYRTRIDRTAYVFSQLQPIDARRVFPGFDDPQFKTPFELSITTRKGLVAVTNTDLDKAAELQGGLVRFRYKPTPALPTYLLAFAVGTLDVRGGPTLRPNELRTGRLRVRGFATRGKREQLAFALRQTPAMVEWLERWFDYPFPWPKLDLIASPAFGGSAMENAGAIVYGDRLLLVDEADGPRTLRAFGEAHAHELAHHWFGNLVTPLWWDDTWLNEAFANWMGKKAAHAWRPELGIDTTLARDAIAVMDRDSRAATRPIRRALSTDAEIGGSFDQLTYAKGSGVLNMFEAWLGPERFQSGVRLHIQRFAGGNATLDDFLASLSEGADAATVAPALRSFLEQPGVPLLDVSLDCANAEPRLNVTQSRYLPLGSRETSARTWQIPMCVAWSEGAELVRQCELISEVNTSVVLDARVCPETVMPNAGGNGYYRFSLPDEESRRLLAMVDRFGEGAALAALDSAAAALRAGRMDLDAFLDAAAVSAASQSPEAVGSMLGELRWIYSELGGRALRDRLIEIYSPALARAEQRLDGDPRWRITRARLAGFIGLSLDDGRVRDPLARQAILYEQNVVFDSQLDPTLRRVALQASLRRDPALEARYLASWLGSDDARLRGDLAAALASTRDPQSARGLLDLLLDRQVRPEEQLSVIRRLMLEPAHRELVLAWLETNLLKLAERQGSLARQSLPRLVAASCDRQSRERIRALFSRVDPQGRMSEALERTLEDVDLCNALMGRLRAPADSA